MKCPICSFDRITNELRCPRCQQALTIWRNFDDYARQSYAVGVDLAKSNPAGAAEQLLKAVIFAPDEIEYILAYGSVLVRLERRAEFAVVVERAKRLSPGCDERIAAIASGLNVDKADMSDPKDGAATDGV